MVSFNKSILLIFLLILILFFSSSVFGCGCGIAITDSQTFGNLNEPETFLVIDVHSSNNYDAVPFFRFVSLDEPYELKVVFPTKEIPSDVEGKKLSIKEFTELYKIREVQSELGKQNASAVIANFSSSYNLLLIPSSIFLNGFGLSFFLSSFFLLSSLGSIAPGQVAHYEFEGGKLDIYDVTKADILQEFVDSLGVEVGEKVKEVVEKYSDHYVAVMTLKVETAIGNEDIEYLKNYCPEGLKKLKELIKTDERITKGLFRQNTRDNFAMCDSKSQGFLIAILENLYSDNSDLEGVMVEMKFENSSNFFYPISIVESYEYPVAKQNYFVRVPENLAIEINSSRVTEKLNVEGFRWYKISENDGDLEGAIVKATFTDFINDSKSKIFSFLYNNAIVINVSLIILLLILFFFKFIKGNKFTQNELIIFLIGGIIITGLYFLTKKEKRKLGILCVLFWILLVFIIPLGYQAVGFLISK